MGIFDRTPQQPAAQPQNRPAPAPQQQVVQQPVPMANPGFFPPVNGQQAAGQALANQGDFNPYAKIKEAAEGGFDRLPYLNTLVGNHILCIDEIKNYRSQETGITSYIVSVHIVHSDNPNAAPGAPYTDMQQSSKKGWLQRVANFLKSAARCTEADIDTQGTIDSYSPSQPFCGTLVAAAVVADAKRNGFLNVNWRALGDGEIKHHAPAEKAINPNWAPSPLQAHLFQ